MSKLEHIKDIFIRESLEEYKEPINNAKPDVLSVSEYRVEKPWGHELWLELNEFYAYKLIHMKKGNKCSFRSINICRSKPKKNISCRSLCRRMDIAYDDG